MSTCNIGFNEDLTKIIFQLSSNIIKYAPYLFFCIDVVFIRIDFKLPYVIDILTMAVLMTIHNMH